MKGHWIFAAAAVAAAGSLMVQGPALAHHSFAAEFDRAHADHRDRQRHESGMGEPARAFLHRREGRPERQDGELGLRACEPERPDAPRLELATR